MLDEIEWFQGISVFEEKNKTLKTLHNLIQFPSYPLLSHINLTVILVYSLAFIFVQCILFHSFALFSTDLRCPIYHTSYRILNFLQEVFPSHLMSEWFFPFHYPHNTVVYTTHLALCLKCVL